MRRGGMAEGCAGVALQTIHGNVHHRMSKNNLVKFIDSWIVLLVPLSCLPLTLNSPPLCSAVLVCRVCLAQGIKANGALLQCLLKLLALSRLGLVDTRVSV
jgi:hypothetical protein